MPLRVLVRTQGGRTVEVRERFKDAALLAWRMEVRDMSQGMWVALRS